MIEQFLSIGARFIEDQMIDTCRIYRDIRGYEDEVLDYVTGALVSPVPKYQTVYEGSCRIAPVRPQQDLEVDIAGHQAAARIYKVLIPVSVNVDIFYNDFLEVTAVANDHLLLGRTMRVLDSQVRTHATYRRFNVVDTTDPLPGAIDVS